MRRRRRAGTASVMGRRSLRSLLGIPGQRATGTVLGRRRGAAIRSVIGRAATVVRAAGDGQCARQPGDEHASHRRQDPSPRHHESSPLPLGPAAAQPAPVVPPGQRPATPHRGDVTGRAETFAQATVSSRLFPGRSQAPLWLRSLDVIMATQTLPASPDGIGGVRQATFSTPSARTHARPCYRPRRRVPSATPFVSTNAPTARWRRGPWWPRWWPRPCPARPTSPLATARHWRRPRAAHRHRRRTRIRTASRRHNRGIDHPASTAPAVAGASGTPPAAALAGGREP
jgi:hypothetical protein